jgi:hypothetical protein
LGSKGQNLRRSSRGWSARYILGGVILGWGGEAERAMEWSEQGMRLSPFDSSAGAEFDAQAMSHLRHGHYEEGCRAAYKSVQANPAHSITYAQLARRAGQTGTVGRSEGGSRASARAFPGLSLQQPVWWCELCASARGVLGGTPDCQSSLANCRDVFSLASDAPLSIELVRPLRAVSAIWRS